MPPCPDGFTSNSRLFGTPTRTSSSYFRAPLKPYRASLRAAMMARSRDSCFSRIAHLGPITVSDGPYSAIAVRRATRPTTCQLPAGPHGSGRGVPNPQGTSKVGEDVLLPTYHDRSVQHSPACCPEAVRMHECACSDFARWFHCQREGRLDAITARGNDRQDTAEPKEHGRWLPQQT